MEDMKIPKNVQAILDWYQAYRPDMFQTVKALFSLDQSPVGHASMLQALLLQGFEAGREFQIKHPEMKSSGGYGAGYLE
jgi:hypothetical protein